MALLMTPLDEGSMIEVAMEADVDDCELEAPNEDKVTNVSICCSCVFE